MSSRPLSSFAKVAVGQLRKAQLEQKVRKVRILDVQPLDLTITPESLELMRASNVAPTSVLKSRPRMDGTGGFVHAMLEKHNPESLIVEDDILQASEDEYMDVVEEVAPSMEKPRTVVGNVRDAFSRSSNTQINLMLNTNGNATFVHQEKPSTAPVRIKKPVVYPCVLCLDVGALYIGVAVSTTDQKQATPLCVINRTREVKDVEEQKVIQNTPSLFKLSKADADGVIWMPKTDLELATEQNQQRKAHNVIVTVVGTPSKEDTIKNGSSTANMIKAFVANMQALQGLGKGLQVIYIDEFASSKRASSVMKKEGLHVKATPLTKHNYHVKKELQQNGVVLQDADYVAKKHLKLDMYSAQIILQDFLKHQNF